MQTSSTQTRSQTRWTKSSKYARVAKKFCTQYARTERWGFFICAADCIKEKLLLVELGEHAKASAVISNHATKQFGEKKLHYAMLQRNKLLHQYATKSPDEFVIPIKSALIQECRLTEHNEQPLSLQGQGLFQDPLAEKSSTKLCL